APRKRERTTFRPGPLPVAFLAENGAVADDAQQNAVRYHDDSAGFDDAFGDAAGKGLFVFVAFAVAIEDLRHRGDAPVDDAYVGGRIQETRPPEQVVLASFFFAHPEVCDVGRARIGRRLSRASFEQSLAHVH